MDFCRGATADPRGLSISALHHRPSASRLLSRPLLPFPSAAETNRLSENDSISRPSPGFRLYRDCLPRYRNSSKDVSAAVFVEESRADVDATEEGEVFDPSESSSVIEYDEVPPPYEESAPLNFLKNLDVKLDSRETYTVLAYGAGAILTLRLSSAVVGTLDSLPLLPKLMEIVGLCYTVWFSYRYLVFKKNRDELLAKIEETRKQILGSSE